MAGLDPDHVEWYSLTAMSTNQSERRDPEQPVERDLEPVEHPAAYEAPSLSVIGVVTELTQGNGIS